MTSYDPNLEPTEDMLRVSVEEVRRLVKDGQHQAVEYVLEKNAGFLGDPEQLMDLIYAEVEQREESGQQPVASEYTARFPKWTEHIQRLLEVHEAFRQADADLSGLPNGSTIDAAFGSSISGTEPSANTTPKNSIGQYELLEEIGSGATGVVFRANQFGLNRQVALKMLRPFGTRDARERFAVEAKLTASLQHPNIVQIHEVGQDADSDFMCMELLEGGSLATTLGHTAFASQTAAELVMTLAGAIAAAHEQGIVHRDLKPGNVLMATDGSPRISDFGLARHLSNSSERQTRTGAILGTPGYMAPEQASGSADVGTAADIYSLGAILYELLAGRPPYHGTSVMEILGQMRVADPPPVSQLRPGVPRDLQTICMKCLEREPEQRYASANILKHELHRYLQGQPIQARPAGLIERTFRWAKRHKTIAALSLLSLTILIVGIAGITSQWRRAEDGLGKAKVATQAAKTAEREQEHQRQLAEDRLYRRQILAANRELQSGASTASLRIMDECDTNRRGWEWDYLRSQSRHSGVTYEGLQSDVWFIDASSDGHLVAGSSGKYTSRSNRKTIVWQAETGHEIWSYSEPGQALCPVFDPTSQRLLIAGHGSATLHNAMTGEVLKRFPREEQFWDWGGAFSPDGNTVAIPNGCGLTLFDINSNAAIDCNVNKAAVGVYAMSFCPDGTRIAAATRKGGVLIFDCATGAITETLETPNDTRFVEFSPSGDLLIASGYSNNDQGYLRVWKRDEAGYELLHTRYERSGSRTGFRFSPDGQCIAVWTGTSPVRLLSPYDLHEYTAYPAHQYTQAVAFGPNSNILLTVGLNGTILSWDRSDDVRSPLRRRDSAYATDFSIRPTGRLVAVAADRNPFQQGRSDTNAVEVMDLNRWQRVRVHTGHRQAVSCLDYDDSGQFLVTGSDDTTLRMWNAENASPPRTIKTHTAPIVGVHFVHLDTSQYVAAIDRTGVVSVHTAESGELIHHHATDFEQVVHTVLHANQIFAGTLSGEVYAVNLDTGTTELVTRQPRPLRCLDVSSDGKQLSLAGDDGSISLWDLNDSSGPTRRWQNAVHSGAAFSVAFHPDGNRVVTTGEDGLIRILETTSGIELLSLKTASYPGPVYRAKFDANTNRLIATTRTLLYSWNTRPAPTDGGRGSDLKQEALTSWHRTLARECEANENWQGAIGHHRLASDDSTAGWRCRHFEAKCHERLKDWPAAQIGYESALALAESHSDNKSWANFRAHSHDNLARLLATCPEVTLRSGQRAVHHATEALKYAPTSATYLKTMAASLFELKRTRDAAIESPSVVSP